MHSLKRPNNHQNQSQIWQECWNYQTKNYEMTVITMLRALMQKVDDMPEQTNNVSTQTEIPRKKKNKGERSRMPKQN